MKCLPPFCKVKLFSIYLFRSRNNQLRLFQSLGFILFVFECPICKLDNIFKQITGVSHLCHQLLWLKGECSHLVALPLDFGSSVGNEKELGMGRSYILSEQWLKTSYGFLFCQSAMGTAMIHIPTTRGNASAVHLLLFSVFFFRGKHRLSSSPEGTM